MANSVDPDHMLLAYILNLSVILGIFFEADDLSRRHLQIHFFLVLLGLTASSELWCLLVTFANRLGPDQDLQNISPDLDQNCLTFYYCVAGRTFQKS